jgi:transaldolase / glucose-6-phosphate isomerase
VSGTPAGLDASIPEAYAPAIDARLARAATDDVAARIFRIDDTLWGPAGQPEVSNRLGWLDVHDRVLAEADDLKAFASQARADGLTEAVVLGMGGSSLAPEVFRRSFGTHDDGLILHVLDSTDADAVRDVEAEIDVSKALFVVSSKSGGTIETLSAFHYFWEKTGGNGAQFVAVTDPGSGLAALGEERGFRRVFLNDPNIGGRYSALSYFGIVPAALLGADLKVLLGGAAELESSLRESDAAQNPGLWLGAHLGELSLAGRDKLTFIVDPPIESYGLWVEQLIAESTGKHGKGILPVADEPLGAPEAYGNDRVFVHLHDAAHHPADAGAVQRLIDAGQPVITIPAHGAGDLGRIMVLFEFATAVAGWVLEINPFDQPNVQSAKDKTKEVLALGAPPDIAEADAAALAKLLGDGPPSYLAIQGYLAPTPEFDGEIEDLRAKLRDRTTMATTFGYGPRYLHSTGQLHKGGRPDGRFLQLLHVADDDVEIPGGDPSSFETLKRAQADGDLLVLRDHGLPAERIVLRGDPVAALRTIKENL